ncbi:MAG: hypothetical protein J5374_05325 [Bacteroidales bacterium]|jgi:hypothetical protein|nr:hypothetical protein [Bacteroidales bacterium]
MKLLDLICPYFGAISICDGFLGDSRKEDALNRFGKDGRTLMDANYHLYANLDLDDKGIENGIVRFEYDDLDSLVRIVLNVDFKNAASMKKSNFGLLYGYLSESDLFDEYSQGEDDWTFRNGINEIHCEEYEDGFSLEIYPASNSGINPFENYESGVFRTVSSLIRGERNVWEDYLLEATTKKVVLKYSREAEEYPCLKLVLTEEEYKQSPASFGMSLTTDVLKMIMKQAGMEEESEMWPERSLERIVLDPVSWEAMDTVGIATIEGAKPMTREQLEEALDEIEYWDRERTSPPGVWDETPIG